MGSQWSKQQQGDAGIGLEPCSDSTPIQSRLFSLDPRSPTEGIDRTPIIVNGTPLRQTMAAAAGVGDALITPVGTRRSDEPFDPRSPATNAAFMRTPVMTPIRFDFAELEQALLDQQQINIQVAKAQTAPQQQQDDETETVDDQTPLVAAADRDADRDNNAVCAAASAPPISERQHLAAPPTSTIAPPTTPLKGAAKTAVQQQQRTTPLTMRSPNVNHHQQQQNSPGKGMLKPMGAQGAAAQKNGGAKGARLRQFAHKNQARRNNKAAAAGGRAVVDENSPVPIRL